MADTSGVHPAEAWKSVDASRESLGRLRARVFQRPIKRALDVFISLLAILILSPVFLMLAILIKASDGGSIFYSHPRIGLGGTPFGCLKFRSMRMDAAAQLAHLLETDLAARTEWEATRKLKNDPRITLVGDVLRRSSLDELPQLINVLRGEMSLVGPRPITAEEQSRYGEYIALYLSVRPGLTGRWQISGRSDVSYQTRVLLDAQYVVGWSLASDLAIMLKTVPVLFSQRGSY